MDDRADVFERIAASLERSAEADEKLLEIANSEQLVMDNGPVICPNCGAHDPIVTPQPEEGSGPLSEYVIIVQGNCCGKIFYTIPSSYIVLKDAQSVEAFMSEGRSNG